jgi:hypothetical protein
MSLSSLLVDQLKALKKPEFDKVVKLYLKEVYGFKRIINTDGPNDEGNDIQVFDLHGTRNQYQVTIQKDKIESKIEEDLEKAGRNYKNLAHTNTLFFFYSRPMTNKQKNAFQKGALKDYGIHLTIIEANQIAEESAETFDSIASLILELNGIKLDKSEEIFGKEANKYKMLYDLISFGSPSDIKGNMVKSFILHSIYSSGEIEKTELLLKLNSYFNTTADKTYCDNLLNNLKKEKKILLNDKGNFILDEKENQRLNTAIRGFELSELALVESISEILSKYFLREHTKEVVNEVRNLYESNYMVDLEELNSKSGDVNTFKKITTRFRKFIIKLKKNEKTADKIIESLITLSEKNDFLQKTSAGLFFANVVQNERFKQFNYLHKSKNVRVFLDTQILLRAICTHYDPSINFVNPFFSVSRDLVSFSRDHSIQLKTINEYCLEVVHHVTNAIQIIPFTRIKELNSLGESRNVFYSFYNSLRSNNQLESGLSFEDFLKEFGFTQSVNVQSTVRRLLRENGIDVINLPKEYTGIQPAKSFRNYQRFSFNKKKKEQAIIFDSRMIEFLADEDVEVQPIDPIFITWDSTFYKVRKQYFIENPSCTKWFMFTPSKFIDHFSLLDFKINPSSLTTELLSIMDEGSPLFSQTQTLLDSIVSIINPNDDVGLKYSSRLNDLRNKEIMRIDDHPIALESDKDFVEDKPIAIDRIFFQLYNHFSKTEESFNQYRDLFTKAEHLDEFITIITNEIEFFTIQGSLSNKLIPNVNKLIKTS